MQLHQKYKACINWKSHKHVSTKISANKKITIMYTAKDGYGNLRFFPIDSV